MALAPLPPPLPAGARKLWRWMPGMLAVRIQSPVFFSEGADPARLVGRSYRVIDVRAGTAGEPTVFCSGEAFPASSPAFAPDLTDPATAGCLLALVRQAWSAPRAHVSPVRDGGAFAEAGFAWLAVLCDRAGHRFGGATEAEALIAALAAATKAAP